MSGQYNTYLSFLGQLAGPGPGTGKLTNGNDFFRPDGATFSPGMGNRVNLFVWDKISEASVDVPTLNDYGLIVTWNFKGTIIGQDGPQPTRTHDAPNTIAFDPVLQPWQTQVVTIDESPTQTDLRRIHIDTNIIRFPKKKSLIVGFEANNRVIPMIAHGDFMTVKFYSDEQALFPGYALSDRLTLWACAGKDAAGDLAVTPA
jgi:hypothetical protein